MIRAIWIGLLLAGLLFVSACSSPPTESVNRDPDTGAETQTPTESTPAESTASGDPAAKEELSGAEAEREGYRLEDEGQAPVSDDVAFEEDRLPPPPEEVGGESLQTQSVDAETVEQLPPVEGDKIPPSVVAPVEPSVTGPVESTPAVGERGFRVQIGASTDRTGAEDLARVARTRTQDSVYVAYESPYFKVRVGDFSDRALALQMRDRLRANGYPEAWVVTTTIKPGD